MIRTIGEEINRKDVKRMENELLEFLKKEGITLERLSEGSGVSYPAIHACLGPHPIGRLSPEELFLIGQYIGKRSRGRLNKILRLKGV